jgi:hypothetical protein
MRRLTVDGLRLGVTAQDSARGKLRLRRVLLALAVGAASASLLISTGVAYAQPPTVELYVQQGGSYSTVCSPAQPCGSVNDAISVAGTYPPNEAFVINVGPGQYSEHVLISGSNFASIAVVGTDGAANTMFRGEGTYGPVFEIDHGTVTLSGLTITGGGNGKDFGGSANGGNTIAGGGVHNVSATLTLTDDNISNDSALSGGGVENDFGTVTMTGDTLAGDTAPTGGGGAVYNGGYYGNGSFGGTITLNDDTLSNDTSEGGFGGAVDNEATATLTNVTMTGDTSPNLGGDGGGGGAVFNGGTATLTDDVMSSDGGVAPYSGNPAITPNGGGVENWGTATLTGDMLSGDTAVIGGGVESVGTITLTDDTLTNDHVPAGEGGGVYVQGASAILTDDTLSDDRASNGGGYGGEGGGVYGFDYQTHIILNFDTFAGDGAAAGGGAVGSDGASITASNSIFESTTATSTLPDCTGVTDGGHNVESAPDTCGFSHSGSTDQVVSDAAIELDSSLALNPPPSQPSYSGPETLAVGPSSAALNEVPASSCSQGFATGQSPTDERGAPRPGIPGQGFCDAGAYELQQGPAASTPRITGSPQPTTAEIGAAIADNATVSGGDNPTGKVTFNLYNNQNGTGPPLFTDTETLTGGSATSATYKPTTRGTDYWVATYDGDGNNTVVSTGNADEPVTITSDADLAISTPANLTVNATGASGATVSYALPRISDPDDATTPTPTCSPASESTFAIGTTTVTCTATDSDDQNSPVNATFTITVRDTDLALTGVPADMVITPTSQNGAIVTYKAPTAVDETGDSASPSVNCDPASGSSFAIGTTTVTCTATDSDDLNSPVEATFTITVNKAPTGLAAAPQLVLLPPGGVGLGNVSATLTSFGEPVVGRTITFSSGAAQLCSAPTASDGTAICSVGMAGELAILLANSYTATFAGDSTFLPSGASTPTIELLGSGLALPAAAGRGHVRIAHAVLTGHGARYTIGARHAQLPSKARGASRLRPGSYTLTVTLTNGRVLHRTVTLR